MTGRLIYLMGPSGAGKDSLLQAARPALHAHGCHIAQRVITREPDAEPSRAVSPKQFDQLERTATFALSWRANGHCYGIPRSIDDHLAAGEDVLVNGSRAYLEQARQRYPDLLAILLTADDTVLYQRLAQRGRESAPLIKARLFRNTLFAKGLRLPFERLDNSGPLQQTVQQLLTLLDRDRLSRQRSIPSAPVQAKAVLTQQTP